MNVLRHLRPECIALDLPFQPREPPEDESDLQRSKRYARDKEALLAEFAGLLDRSGVIVNRAKLERDLVHRERKATTGIAPGVAIPHVRSMQVRSFIMGFARAPAPGWPFLALDGEPTRFFFLLASPPWDDRVYHQLYKELADLIQDDEVMAGLTTATTAQEVMNVFRGYFVR